jgi:hypothetical protein
LREVAEETVRKRMPGVVRVVGVDVEAEATCRSRPEPAPRSDPVLFRVNPELEGVLTPGDRETVAHVVIDIRFLLRKPAGLIISVAGRILQATAAVRNGWQQIVRIDLGMELTGGEAVMLPGNQVVVNPCFFVLPFYAGR